MSPIERIFDILQSEGPKNHEGGGVRQFEHALPCATLADKNGAPASPIAASPPHDIGRPYAEGAAHARRRDERAEAPGLETPPLEYFQPHLQACLRTP